MTASPQTTMVPAAAVLSTWQAHGWANGVALATLAPLDRLIVRTRHSVYEVILSDPSTGDVLVRGGAYFPEFTRVRLAGCTMGGSFLKIRSVHVGFRVEFSLGRQYVLTSPVQTIDVISPAEAAG